MVSPAGHPTQSPQPLPNVILLLRGAPSSPPSRFGPPFRWQWKEAHYRQEGNAASAQKVKLPLKACGLKEETIRPGMWDFYMTTHPLALKRTPFGGWEKWHTHLIPELGRRREAVGLSSKPACSRDISHNRQIYMVRPCLKTQTKHHLNRA